MPDHGSVGYYRSSMTAQPNAELRGRVRRFLYVDEKKRYTEAKLQPEGHDYVVTVIGNLGEAEYGDEVVCLGRWRNDETHGWHFQSEECEVVPDWSSDWESEASSEDGSPNIDRSGFPPLPPPNVAAIFVGTAQGQQPGPIPLEALLDLVKAGRLPPDLAIWYEGMPQWVRALNHPELRLKIREAEFRALLAGVPPAPTATPEPAPEPEPASGEEEGPYIELSVDVRMGIYDDANIVVDYYAGGTIGTAPPQAELCAVVNFHERYNLPAFPVGIIPVEQPSFFGKKTMHHFVGGTGYLPIQPVSNYDEARTRIQSLALTARGDIIRSDPQVRPLIATPQPYSPIHRGFQARHYGVPFEFGERDMIARGTIHVVIHFEADKYPSAAVLIGDRTDQNPPYYLVSFMTGDKMENLRRFGSKTEALTFATQSVVIIATALYQLATTVSLQEMFTKLGMPMPKTFAGAKSRTPQQAQALYEQIINQLR